jgi:hypothetical protein
MKFKFRKRWSVSCLAERPLATQEEVLSMELLMKIARVNGHQHTIPENKTVFFGMRCR